MGTSSAPLRKAMYVASELDRSWLQSEQRRLYERSRNNPDYVFCKLWGLVTDPRNQIIEPLPANSNAGEGAVRQRERIGGVLRYYREGA
jgi:hypothetical protein